MKQNDDMKFDLSTGCNSVAVKLAACALARTRLHARWRCNEDP